MSQVLIMRPKTSLASRYINSTRAPISIFWGDLISYYLSNTINRCGAFRCFFFFNILF